MSSRARRAQTRRAPQIGLDVTRRGAKRRSFYYHPRRWLQLRRPSIIRRQRRRRRRLERCLTDWQSVERLLSSANSPLSDPSHSLVSWPALARLGSLFLARRIVKVKQTRRSQVRARLWWSNSAAGQTHFIYRLPASPASRASILAPKSKFSASDDPRRRRRRRRARRSRRRRSRREFYYGAQIVFPPRWHSTFSSNSIATVAATRAAR